MKKGIVASLLAMGVVFGLTIAPAWAKTCPKLYKDCQEALKKTPNKDAENLCGEGIKLHEQAKHDESVAKLTAGLEKLGIKVEMKK